jgi:hypothetical protein
MRDSEAEKRRSQNAKAELISRKHGEVVYIIPPIQRREREKYPWEEKEENSEKNTAKPGVTKKAK